MDVTESRDRLQGYPSKARIRDDRYIESLLAEDRIGAAEAGIEPRAHALIRVGALIAMNAAPPSYMSATEAALQPAQPTRRSSATLIVVMPIVGVAHVVSAAPNLGLAIGYDVGDALESLENGQRSP